MHAALLLRSVEPTRGSRGQLLQLGGVRIVVAAAGGFNVRTAASLSRFLAARPRVTTVRRRAAGSGDAVSALYPGAYALKSVSRKALERDYVVMPLEGLWWAEDMDTFTSARDKSRWSWTMMVMVPDWITAAMFTGAVEQVARKDRPARLDDLRLDVLSEGCCVQALHVGSYDDEAELLRRMHEEFIPAHGLRMVGRHHEIYLSDARRVEPVR